MSIPSWAQPTVSIPELEDLRRLTEEFHSQVRVEHLCELPHHGGRLPVVAVAVGSRQPDAPTLMCVGGVHGLERIGAQVVLSFIHTLLRAAQWDRNVEYMLSTLRVLFLPVLNPVGVLTHRRSNGRGVDLMRNAPVESQEWDWPLAIHRGHRLTHRLPWFRGTPEQMEPESQALCDWTRRECFRSRRVVSLDVHSGFFGPDRLWFPYAKTRSLFPHAPEIVALKGLLKDTYQRHRYVIEPQSSQYTTHGDLWDYLYDEYREVQPQGVFLPLTLELGASSWLKKSRRVFDKAAFFHPLSPKRTRRVLRRHVQLFEFLLRAVFSWSNWAPQGERRSVLEAEARRSWLGSPLR